MSGCARQRGFTLLEVLLATTLLAAGLALAFATLRTAAATTERGSASLGVCGTASLPP